ncbi:MAG: PBP1A family penicillin-binding protein [Spirochaetia bacterium]|nr:PBP1A family penicillin-binding protein [Spirochaetia bacterium]
MKLTRPQRIIIITLFVMIALVSVLTGAGLGIACAMDRNVQTEGLIKEFTPSLPSTLLDINGEVITEFFAEEKRDIIPVEEMPKNLIYALITREDKNFFTHCGFSLKGTFRAAWNILLGKYVSGGSTITQQVAGANFSDRTQKTLKRKLVELWWAFELEKNLTKNQILEMYLNESYFGHNTYGVEAASQFYFKHSARDLGLAESAILVIQLANPARYSPIKNPNRAKIIQQEVLNQVVDAGFTTKEAADLSFEQYWNNIYDPLRSTSETAYLIKNNKAPYFSEYIRQELENLLYGRMDYHRDGLVIHTTLDLNYQRIADKYMEEGIYSFNRKYQESSGSRISYVDREFVPMVEALALMYNLAPVKTSGVQQKKYANKIFQEDMTPILKVTSLLLNSEELDFLADMAFAKGSAKQNRNTIEGALIILENETGYIKAMVGGSDFEVKKLNRAVQAKVMPGSSFKPLYYSAAISSGKITPATMLYDKPMVFWNDDGTPYTPLNFLGEWQGTVTIREALSQSMNVPSIQVLDMIGFDAAINRASRLLGITDPVEIENTFPRKYPLGLGIISVAPIQMAKAFATFANQGKEVTPLGITYIEDRNGKILFEEERELRAQQMEAGDRIQILSPQAAYVMVDLLKSTVQTGTLANRRRAVGDFPMPFAGKTGTTQNWSDAWTVGFSPYLTTAVWFGFDMPGNSLGLNQTGATAAGPIWANVMKDIHLNNPDFPPKDFDRPATGLTEVDVCRKSGKIPTAGCTDGIRKEIFITGTEPDEFCTYHKFAKERDEELLKRLEEKIFNF